MSFNLSITPAQIEILSKIGKTITQTYQIKNNSDSIVNLSTSIEQWQPINNDGSIQYLPESTSPVLFSLLNADLKLGQIFSLPPNQSTQLILKIQIPQSIPESYFTLFLKQENQSKNETSSYLSSFSNTNAKIGSHILIATSETENLTHKAAIGNFTTTPKIKDIFFSKIKFNIEITNQSDYLFKNQGKLTITKNNAIFKEITLFENNTLANHSRLVRCSFSESDLKPIQCSLSPPFWPGLYQASVKLDNNIKLSNNSTSFFILPISPIIFILLITALFLTIKKRFLS
ncbi:hypothetical protein KKC08_04240 [Patescibacteria group bacterium]|nr:hypothetical protein [Patescibacteria group bacterium]MBU4430592.1 hypothetical protein [Patescibacteria group bacterium]MCG2702119.1 hypothetical protein [Candidatus Parcubacteria bacterium]